MSIDRTLKLHGGLLRSRSVLSRAERIAILTEEGKFDPAQDNPLGLPKVRVRHSRAGTKKKAAATTEDAAAAAPDAQQGDSATAAKG